MKKFLTYLGVISLVITLTACSSNNKRNDKKPSEPDKKANTEFTNDINVVTSLEDKIDDNTAWCGTFNLVWDILKEEYVKGDIVVDNPTEQILNLNKTVFNKSYLSENGYYTKFGKQTPALKSEIEKAIKEKFDQTSDILDNFDWQESSNTDFIYAMLYKKFTFKTPFGQLKNGEFNGQGDYRYFGINDENVEGKEQVDVLYYDLKKDEYAVKLNTKENEEVILVYTSDKINNFNELYKQIVENTNKYEGSKKIESDDSLRVPYLKFNIYKEFDELANIKFKQADGEERTIGKAVQTIQFQLSESGGDIKSEAAISTELTSAYDPDKNPRVFAYTRPFVIYLKEKDKDVPYFAAYVTDLSKFQN
jgi:hypothetical protein